jgi:hypothetical protein
LANGHVAASLDEPRQQLIARDRHGDHVHVVLRLADVQRPVETLFEGPHALGDQAALAPAIDEVERLAVDHQSAHEAALDHAVQIIAGAQILEAFEQHGLRRGGGAYDGRERTEER